MTQSISFNSLSSLSPQTIKGYDCDGIVDDKPVRVRYNRFGGVVPTVGSTLLTTYGVGKVTGYNEGSLIVAITKFNDEYIFITADGEDCYDAVETVAKLSQCANRGVDSLVSDITRLYKSEITGKLSKSMQDKVDSLRRFAPNEFIMDLTDKSDSCQLLNGSVLVDVVATERETKAERKARKAMEIAEAKRLRRQLLDAYDAECPEDVAAEIADEFGETDEMNGQDGEF
tara:strand:+ start:3001 stop:3687 length:687 start_codon:yes stop_codon:yes gene_type:complete